MTNSADNPDPRLRKGLDWLRSLPGPGADWEPSPVAGDASFRRYFRLRAEGTSRILMDAPPDREDSQPFLDVAARLVRGGVHAPEIMAADPGQGFMLLEDLGDGLLRDILNGDNASSWFRRLFDLLERMAGRVEAEGLPRYSRQLLQEEMQLFPDWYLGRHKGIRLTGAARDDWDALCGQLLWSAAQQPEVFVHKDFHSCNLLLTPAGDIGVIDFQDAVRGPLTYDFVSLVWDRYIAWPRERLEDWMEAFRQRVASDTPPETWIRWCDWMGLQRNLKVVGIFARLRHRDGKQGYLEMIPRFWDYLMDVLPRYPETREFATRLGRLKCAP